MSGGAARTPPDAQTDLLFVASGGAGTGLGHVLRCAELAREARGRGRRVAMALRGDDAARAAWSKELPGVEPGPWRDASDVAGRARWTVVDTRDACEAELEAVRRAGGRSVVLDRTDHADRADWTVLPVLHARRPEHPRVRAGGPWVVVPEAVRRLGVAPEAERDGWLVTFGGADPLDCTARSAAILVRTLGADGAPVRVVVGPAFARRAGAMSTLEGLGLEVLDAPSRPELAGWMRRARGAVAGFGTTLHELAWLGVPMLHVAHHREDVAAGRRLEALGVGAHLGYGGELEPDALRQQVERTLLDPAWRRRAAARGRERVGDGRGAAHLVDLLLHDLGAPAESRPEVRARETGG